MNKSTTSNLTMSNLDSEPRLHAGWTGIWNYSIALFCLIIHIVANSANSGCPAAAMQVSLDTKENNQWSIHTTGNGNYYVSWETLVSEIQQSQKPLYCCNDTIDIYDFRIIVPTCSDVGTFYTSPFYIMGTNRNGKLSHFKLFWNKGGTHAEPGKTYEIAIAQKFNSRISKLIMKSFQFPPSQQLYRTN